MTARVLADALRDSIGHPVVVQNRPGATGRIAAEALKRATPDGTTFLLAPMVVAVLAPLVFRDPGYDASKDLVPVAQVSRYALAMAVRADHPARTVPEFVAWARANPARASIGTGGSGSLPHLLAVLIGRATDTAFVHVPYSSLAQVETELLGGQIAAAIGNVGDFAALDRSGNVRIIAVSTPQRSARLPAVPTFAEQGLPAVVAIGWNAVFAPPGTPKAMIDGMAAAIGSALQVPDVRSRFDDLGVEAAGTTPDELAAIIAADLARWAPVVKASGLDVHAR